MLVNNHMDRVYEDIHSVPITSITKRNIIESGIELFSQRGYSGVSIRDITKEVGIKESSLYKHFKSKEELIETIFHNFRKACTEILPPMEYLDQIVAEMNLKSFLEQGWVNFKKHIDNPINQKTWRIIYIELFRHAQAREIYTNDIVKKTMDCLEVVFSRMAESGKVKPMDPKVLAREYQYPLFMMVMEYNLLKSQNYSTEGLEQDVVNHIEYFSNMAGEEASGFYVEKA